MLKSNHCCGASQSPYILVGDGVRVRLQGGEGGCSTLDKTEEILYDILIICSHIDEMLFKINEFF